MEEELGPIDVWVNVAFTSVFAPFDADRARGVQAGHRGQLPRLRLRDQGGAGPDAAARPRGRSSRSGRRWPTAASRCSRRTAAPSTPSRVSTSRCAASCCTTQQRARDDGADAGGEHPAVLLGALPAAPPRAAGATDLPARGRRPGGRVRRGPSPAPGVLGRGSTAATLIANAVAPGLLDRYLGRTGFDSQQTEAPRDPDAATEPVGARRRAGRSRLRGARHLRRQVDLAQLPAVGLPARETARLAGCRCRRRVDRPARGPIQWFVNYR